MSQDTRSLPQGAGATTGSSSDQNKFAAPSRSETQKSSPSSALPSAQPPSDAGFFSHDEHETGHRTSGSALVLAERETNRPNTAVIVGSAIAGAIVGGAIPFMLAGRSSATQSRRDGVAFKETVTINRSARELYDFWRDFSNLPQFMDNIRSVEKLGSKRSHWVIKAPAGTSVEFDSRVVDDVPGKLIAWESEEGASVPNRGRVEFNQTSSGATVVRTAISYDPPAGAAGRMIAKLFQREPAMQAREDLARFKELMESSGSR
jgi:uncharacterized membrane protein